MIIPNFLPKRDFFFTLCYPSHRTQYREYVGNVCSVKVTQTNKERANFTGSYYENLFWPCNAHA